MTSRNLLRPARIIVAFLVLQQGICLAITAEDLANKCLSAESAIQDISLEYEWYNLPPLTREELFKTDQENDLLPKDGKRTIKLIAARFAGSADMNSYQQWRKIVEISSTVIDKEGHSWDNILKFSYNGKISKRLDIEARPDSFEKGFVFSNKEGPISILLTPIGFSILRFGNDAVTKGVPLSSCLRHKEIVRIDDSVSKINDFNAISVEFLQEYSKLPCIRVYFSIDHNYTPVKYEYLNSGRAGTRLAFAVEIHSLEPVAEGLWFPGNGIIRDPNREMGRVDAFQVIGKILINQGLSEKDFDINFPVGTTVSDQIAGREYIVK